MSDSLLQAASGVLQFPAAPPPRRHGPRGYAAVASYKPWLRDEFAFRCVYCLCRERWQPNGADAFSIEHLDPRSSHPQQVGDYDNLLYACCTCNASRADAPLPFDPSRVNLGDHLRVTAEGSVQAVTAEGAALVDICRLNRP